MSASAGSPKVAGAPPGATGLPPLVQEIALLSGLGYPLGEIGTFLGTSSTVCAKLLQQHRRFPVSRESHPDLTKLSARAANVLGRHGVSTPEEARNRNLSAILQNERNCGAKTLQEINAWIGQTPAGSARRQRGLAATPAPVRRALRNRP